MTKTKQDNYVIDLTSVVYIENYTYQTKWGLYEKMDRTMWPIL